MAAWTILDHFGPVHFPTVTRPLPILGWCGPSRTIFGRFAGRTHRAMRKIVPARTTVQFHPSLWATRSPRDPGAVGFCFRRSNLLAPLPSFPLTSRQGEPAQAGHTRSQTSPWAKVASSQDGYSFSQHQRKGNNNNNNDNNNNNNSKRHLM